MGVQVEFKKDGTQLPGEVIEWLLMLPVPVTAAPDLAQSAVSGAPTGNVLALELCG